MAKLQHRNICFLQWWTVSYFAGWGGGGSFHRDRPISVVVLHVFRESERDAGGGVGGTKMAMFV